MSIRTETLGEKGRFALRVDEPASTWSRDEDRQLRRLLLIGFLLLLVPAAIGRLTGWRWRPWPPGPQGYSSILREAKAAADTYVPLGFIG